jgi:hypothetical protein
MSENTDSGLDVILTLVGAKSGIVRKNPVR